MTTTAAPEWHERVRNCGECPFGGYSEYPMTVDPIASCDAAGEELRRMTDAEFDASTPPSWCPLRTGPRVVKLAEVR